MLQLDQICQRLTQHHPQILADPQLQPAAVAMLLRRTESDTEVLLIKRAEHELDPWSGDLGFPGGRIEAEDSGPRAAAERETAEEIGLQLSPENYLGRTDDLSGAYLSVCISCFVYQIDTPVDFTLNYEVVDLFWVPLRTLLDPQRNRLENFAYRGSDRNHPIVELREWSERPLWGITYRLLGDFFNLFDLSFNHPERL